jgi:hypothetical protein
MSGLNEKLNMGLFASTFQLSQNYISKFSFKTIRRLSIFAFSSIPIFLLNPSSCIAIGIGSNTVTKVSFPGGTYDSYIGIDSESKITGQGFYNFQNNTGSDANDFHVTYNYPGEKGVLFSLEINFPSSLGGSFPANFLVPSGGFYSPGIISGIGGHPFFPIFLSNVYWTLGGEPLGDPLVPPVIVKPLISGNNSYCIGEFSSNSACQFGIVGDVPLDAPPAVPEPFTIIGTLIGGTAAFQMRKKLKAIAD